MHLPFFISFFPLLIFPSCDHRRILPSADENLLTVGQLQWMDYELFLPALKPFFLSVGIPPSQVDRIIRLAQNDLYYPSTCQSSRLHIVYASKSLW